MNTKISLFKFNAFVSEFPELAWGPFDGRDQQDCESIKVKRITQELFLRTPRQYEAVGPSVNVNEGDLVFVVFDKEAHEVKADWTLVSNYADDDGGYRSGETLLEACQRLDVEPALIVWVEYGLGCVNHHSSDGWRATIYKPSSGTSARDLVAGAYEKALAEVRAESAF